ncbi:hypothetical protein C7M84_018621 [Penaeus vannamei]|uniref:Uncharacterized protein n=1 Tax=Penaeus vannamei TaxID=6689 RepID=A0A3R7LSS9_PENVA|nr:hypothetical protein C7M84_018621 [Penaeus vannamei]
MSPTPPPVPVPPPVGTYSRRRSWCHPAADNAQTIAFQGGTAFHAAVCCLPLFKPPAAKGPQLAGGGGSQRAPGPRPIKHRRQLEQAEADSSVMQHIERDAISDALRPPPPFRPLNNISLCSARERTHAAGTKSTRARCYVPAARTPAVRRYATHAHDDEPDDGRKKCMRASAWQTNAVSESPIASVHEGIACRGREEGRPWWGGTQDKTAKDEKEQKARRHNGMKINPRSASDPRASPRPRPPRQPFRNPVRPRPCADRGHLRSRRTHPFPSNCEKKPDEKRTSPLGAASCSSRARMHAFGDGRYARPVNGFRPKPFRRTRHRRLRIPSPSAAGNPWRRLPAQSFRCRSLSLICRPGFGADRSERRRRQSVKKRAPRPRPPEASAISPPRARPPASSRAVRSAESCTLPSGAPALAASRRQESAAVLRTDPVRASLGSPRTKGPAAVSRQRRQRSGVAVITVLRAARRSGQRGGSRPRCLSAQEYVTAESASLRRTTASTWPVAGAEGRAPEFLPRGGLALGRGGHRGHRGGPGTQDLGDVALLPRGLGARLGPAAAPVRLGPLDAPPPLRLSCLRWVSPPLFPCSCCSFSSFSLTLHSPRDSPVPRARPGTKGIPRDCLRVFRQIEVFLLLFTSLFFLLYPPFFSSSSSLSTSILLRFSPFLLRFLFFFPLSTSPFSVFSPLPPLSPALPSPFSPSSSLHFLLILSVYLPPPIPFSCFIPATKNAI